MTTSRKAICRPLAWVLALILLAAEAHNPASAASLSPRDVLIMAKAIGFLEPPPSGAVTVAIAYDPADPASKQDADTIAGYFGEGLKAGSAILKPKVVEAGQLGGGGFIAVVAAGGAKIAQVAAAAQALHITCITADTAAVVAGQCVMSVKSEPKVEIQINRAAATSSGVAFGSAFLLMAHAI